MASMAIRITATTIMTTDTAKLLRLQSWLSPAFPIGAFSYSHGLEWAVEEGSVRDRAALVDWLDADLRHGAGRLDGVLFAAAWRVVRGEAPSPDRLTASALAQVESLYGEPQAFAFGRGQESVADSQTSSSPALAATGKRASADLAQLLALAAYAAALRGTAEFALESGQQGIAFLGTVRKAWPHPELDAIATALSDGGAQPILPVAAGLTCAVHEIPLDLALPLYLHSWVANLVNAALRLVPLGQTDGQIAVAALEGAVAETAAEALAADLSAIGSAAFMLDIASMRHETQYTRLFRS
jgi:urease accessory protein